jgi:hypothetical protein
MTRIAIVAPNPDWAEPREEDALKIEKFLRAASILSEDAIKEKVKLARRSAELRPRELQYIYYLDPAHGYAVRRFQVLTKDGRLRMESNLTNYTKLSDYDIWLATTSFTDYYTSEGSHPGEIFESPFVTHVIEFSKYSTTPVPDGQFTLNYTSPGTYVTDKTLPEAKALPSGAVRYRVPANPEDLNRVIEEARKGDTASSPRLTLKIVLMIGNTIALGALFAYLVIRRRVAKS